MRAFIIGLMMLVIGACASTTSDGTVEWNTFGQEIADSLVQVKPENRDLRVCLISAGAVEVMTDLAQRGGNAQLALGNLMLLQNAIDKARSTDPLWSETDNADVTLLFAKVLKDSGKSRLSQILMAGPTISNFVNIANRAVVLTVKGHAVLKDINSMLRAVENGDLEKAEAWRACENRLAMNRAVLQVLNGGHLSSADGVGFWGTDYTQMVELDFIDGNPGFEGWLDWIPIADGRNDEGIEGWRGDITGETDFADATERGGITGISGDAIGIEGWGGLTGGDGGSGLGLKDTIV